MKIVIAIVVWCAFSSADHRQAVVESNRQLTTYNQRPSVKMRHALKLKRLAYIDTKQANKIAKEICQEPVRYHTLTHKGQLLFYHISTEHCRVKINALDGSMITKEVQ